MLCQKEELRQRRHAIWRYPGLLMMVLLIFLNVNSSWAASSDTEERYRRDRQEAVERKQREQQQDIFLQPKPTTPDDTTLPDETPSFVITTLRLEGKEVHRFPWAQKLLDQYAGRRIGKEGINRIAKRLTNAFIDRGYITTRVVVPEQDLSSGVLRLTLIPGVIRDIRFADPTYPGSWRAAFPLRPGDILNLRDLEQGLEQMKRVPSQDVDIQIMPGQQPGESDIVITVKQAKPERIVISLDDSGSKATGRLQASVTVALDNLGGFNDLLHISLNSDAEPDGHLYGTRGDSIDYSWPYGYWTFIFSGSRYNYHQTIQGTNETFQSSGESDKLEFRVTRLVHRDRSSKTHLEAGITKAHSKNYIDDTEIEVQRKNTTAAELALSHRQYFGQTTVDVKIANKHGVPWFNAQSEPEDLPPDTPTTRYSLWTLDAGITTPVKLINKKARYSATLRAQYTQDRLYAAEYIQIGNRYTVRGFDGEQTLAAERGWFWQNELSVPVSNRGAELYLGLDYGQVSGAAAATLSGTELAGTVLGLRGQAEGIQYDLFAGWPLAKPDGFKTAIPTLGFQLTYQV